MCTTTETGRPTELCLRLRKREDKPHLYIARVLMRFRLTTDRFDPRVIRPEVDFATKVNPVFYKTPGEAARAWHNYKATGA